MSNAPMEPALSGDETAALLTAMRGAQAGQAAPREVELGSPDHRLRQALGTADIAARELCLDVKRLLRKILSTSLSVREGAAEVVTFNIMSQSLAPGSGIAVIKTPDGGMGFLVVGPTLLGQIMHRRLGGSSSVSSGDLGGRSVLSAVDRRIVRPFMEDVLEAFSQKWPLPLKVEEVLARSADLPRLGHYEPLLRLPLSIQLSVETTEELSILLGAGAVPQNKPAEDGDAPKEPALSSGDRARMLARLTDAQVEVRAVLGRTQSSVRRVLSLAIGDVIRLEEAPEQPVEVRVEGTAKMLGQPVVRHGNIAIEISEMLEGKP